MRQEVYAIRAGETTAAGMFIVPSTVTDAFIGSRVREMFGTNEDGSELEWRAFDVESEADEVSTLPEQQQEA